MAKSDHNTPKPVATDTAPQIGLSQSPQDDITQREALTDWLRENAPMYWDPINEHMGTGADEEIQGGSL